MNPALVGQLVKLRRIGNPPARVTSAAGRRIANPPQVGNLPHTFPAGPRRL